MTTCAVPLTIARGLLLLTVSKSSSPSSSSRAVARLSGHRASLRAGGAGAGATSTWTSPLTRGTLTQVRGSSSVFGAPSSSATWRVPPTRRPGHHQPVRAVGAAVQREAGDNTPAASEEATDTPDEGRTEMLQHTVDRYGGVIIDHESLPPTAEAFVASLAASIDAWVASIPTGRAELVGHAVHEGGFGFHHAEPTYVMLTRWLPMDEENLLPPNASHQVGIGAFITNGKNEVLLVQERRGPAASRPDFWKLPTGLVEQGEDIPEAAVREVFEETGVKAEFVSILGIRHGHNIAFGKSDMFFLVALRIADGAADHAITIQEQELVAAAWKPLEDMANNPHIMPGSHMDHMYGLCIEHAKGTYAGMGWQALPMGFNRDADVVTYSNAPRRDVMAKRGESAL